jgi:hypothetical protein
MILPEVNAAYSGFNGEPFCYFICIDVLNNCKHISQKTVRSGCFSCAISSCYYIYGWHIYFQIKQILQLSWNIDFSFIFGNKASVMKKIFLVIVFFISTLFINAQILSPREQAKVVDEILAERFNNLLPQLMQKNSIDMWVLISREYN